MGNFSSTKSAVIAVLGSIFGLLVILSVIISIFVGVPLIFPEEINLTFHVIWPENESEWFTPIGPENDSITKYAPIEEPPQSVRIVKSDEPDGYEMTDSPDWTVIKEFILEPMEEPNRTYIAQGNVPKKDIDYLAAVSGIPPNHFDGVVAIKLDSFEEGEIVELRHIESLMVIDKPNIYLYSTTTTITDTIEVEIINGKIIKSDPYAHRGSKVTWEDVRISPEGMSYENNSIDWLFYEAIIDTSLDVYTSVLDYGWIIERQENQYIFEENHHTYDQFQEVFIKKLLTIGLYQKEAEDFVEWWFNNDTKLIQEDGKFVLRMMDSTWIEQHFILTSNHTYEQLRLFFLCHPFKDGLDIQEPPSYSSKSNLVLHEWGVIPYF
jgi:hypothetical protein